MDLRWWRKFEFVPFQEWKVREAFVRMHGDIGTTTEYLFQHVDKPDDFWRPRGLLEVSEQLQVEVKYTAPWTVGEYTSSIGFRAASVTSWWSSPLPAHRRHPYAGAGGILTHSSSPTTRWVVQTTIKVIPAEIVPGQSFAAIQETMVAGKPASMRVSPKDRFGNVIDTFGLSFTATLTRRENNTIAGVLYRNRKITVPGEAEFAFDSHFDPEASAYVIILYPPVMGPYRLLVRYGEVIIPPRLTPVVQSTLCDDVSYPNEAGTACLCNEGFARQFGVCAACPAGYRPKQNREDGCDSCTFQPGTVSTSGLECEECAAGLRPNPQADMCIPCPPNEYYDLEQGKCDLCQDGQMLVLGQGLPCAECPPGFAGTGGTCSACPDGQMPTERKDRCIGCPMGAAGTAGMCPECEPGRYQNDDQTDCLLCDRGRYRNAEPRPDCVWCDANQEMTSDPGSRTKLDCRCGAGQYDLLDNPEDGTLCSMSGVVKSPLGLPSGCAADCTAEGECFWLPDASNHITGVATRNAGDPVGVDILYSWLSAVVSILATGISDDDYLPNCTDTDASWCMGEMHAVNYNFTGNPIWCFPQGRIPVPQKLKANQDAADDIHQGRRCVRCPDCLDCGLSWQEQSAAASEGSVVIHWWGWLLVVFVTAVCLFGISRAVDMPEPFRAIALTLAAAVCVAVVLGVTEASAKTWGVGVISFIAVRLYWRRKIPKSSKMAVYAAVVALVVVGFFCGVKYAVELPEIETTDVAGGDWCDDPLDDDPDGCYRGVPFIKRGWTFVNVHMFDDYSGYPAVSRLDPVGGTDCSGYSGTQDLETVALPTAAADLPGLFPGTLPDGCETCRSAWKDAGAVDDKLGEDGCTGKRNCRFLSDPDLQVPQRDEYLYPEYYVGDATVCIGPDGTAVNDAEDCAACQSLGAGHTWKDNLDNGHFFEVPEGESALVNSHYRSATRGLAGTERNVLGCQSPGSCNAEREYRNKTGVVERCAAGYSGPMW